METSDTDDPSNHEKRMCELEKEVNNVIIGLMKQINRMTTGSVDALSNVLEKGRDSQTFSLFGRYCMFLLEKPIGYMIGFEHQFLDRNSQSCKQKLSEQKFIGLQSKVKFA